VLLQPSDLHIIHMTEPLSAKCTLNPVVNLLVYVYQANLVMALFIHTLK